MFLRAAPGGEVWQKIVRQISLPVVVMGLSTVVEGNEKYLYRSTKHPKREAINNTQDDRFMIILTLPRALAKSLPAREELYAHA